MGAEMFHTLKGVLKSKGYSTAVGDEGGFAPNLKSNDEAHRSHPGGHRQGRLQARRADLASALDPAASEFYDTAKAKYVFKKSDKRELLRRTRWSTSGPTGCSKYPIISIEDGMAEDDWDGWKMLTDQLGEQDPARGRRPVRHQHRAILAKGIEKGVANSILIKVNQIGTLTETLEAMEHGRRAPATPAWSSHRSGETEDTFIADLAVATSAGQIKTGSAQPHRPHRQVQPVAPHRGGTGRRRPVRRPQGVQTVGGADDHVQTRSHPPRRKHLEQGEPLHRLDRRGPVRKGRRRRPSKPARCCKREGYTFDVGLHLGAEARHPHLRHRARRDGPDVDPGASAPGG